MKPSEETLTKVARYIIRAGKRQAIRGLQTWIYSSSRPDACPFGQLGTPTYRHKYPAQRYSTCPCLLIWPHLCKISYSYNTPIKELREEGISEFCPCYTTKSHCKSDHIVIDPSLQLTPAEIISTATSLLHIIEKTKRL